MWPFNYFRKKREKAELERRRAEEEIQRRRAEEEAERRKQEEERQQRLKAEEERKKKEAKYATSTEIKSELNGDKLQITIPTTSGSSVIVADTVIDPQGGDRCIIYDNYFFTINQCMKNGTDINYYLGKLQIAANGISNGVDWQDAVRFMMEQHIKQHGRIIDSDLMMICSAVHQVLEANKQNISLTTIQLQSLQMAQQEFLKDLVVTQFKNTPMGPQPQLVKGSEFFQISMAQRWAMEQ